MTGILDKMAGKRPQISFRPTTARQMFVLRLAQKLGEPRSVAHYAELARCHSDETLLLAYWRTLKHGSPGGDLARKFHAELASMREKEHERDERGEKPVAIKIERRCVAVAVFSASMLEYHDIRYLDSDRTKAEASAISFLHWVVDSFKIGYAALESTTRGHDLRRGALNRAIIDQLRGKAIPVWEVSRPDLLDAYAHPPLRVREQVRRAVHEILWSMFNTDDPTPQELEAAALGLYAQTERRFINF